MAKRPQIPSGPAPLVGDRPVERSVDDGLERGGLVDAIVRTVERAPREGFVIGIAGPWGEGKTSILNMAAERLGERGSAQVVRFNPWLFAGSGELLQRFFSELSSELRLKGGAGSERAANALSKYGAAAGPLSAAPVAGPIIGATSRVAKGGATLLRAGRTLHEQRRELHEALGELDRPIVVIVDDLDRPHADSEIAEMVRLIRLVGDLPRVTYLVAYERKQVARALGDGDDQRGEDYLEKIVQAVFELPPARRDLLDNLLTEAIDEAIGDLADLHFSAERWSALQFAGIRSLFRNLRDVRRFASALTATVALVGEEVELADVLALETLRLLEPRVFDALVREADLMTGGRPRFSLPGQQRDEDERKRVEAVVSEARRPEVVRDVIRELFPAIAGRLGGTNYSDSFQSAWRRERRVAHRDGFTAYLERGVPSGSMSARDVREALDSLDDREKLERLLTTTPDKRLMSVLSRLEDYEGSFELQHPEMTVEVLASAIVRFRPRKRAFLEYNAEIAVSRLLLRVLRGRAPEDVEAILDKARAPDLSSRIELVRLVGHREGTGSRLVREINCKASRTRSRA